MYKMDQLSKQTLYIITFSLDAPLLYGLNTYNFSTFDQIWVSSVLGCHFFFMYALYSNNYRLIDILHYFVAILPFLSLLTTHILLKMLSCSLLIVIQILWIKEKRCIMNVGMSAFGYGDKISYFILFLTVTLSGLIGYDIGTQKILS